MDLFTKCNRYEDAAVARKAGTYPYFIPLDRSEGTEVIFEGRRIIMCGSNNYLGLTMHPKVREAAKKCHRPLRHELYRFALSEWQHDHHRRARARAG